MRILCRSGGALLTVLAMLLCTATLLAAPAPARAERTRALGVTGVKAVPAVLTATAALVATARKSDAAPYSPHAVAGHTTYNTKNARVPEPDGVGVPQPVPRE